MLPKISEVKRVVACVLAAAISASIAQTSHATITVKIDDSCGSQNLPSNDLTANPIVLRPETDSCEIRWSSAENLADEVGIDLYFGQPNEVLELTKTPISFEPQGDGSFVAARRFSREELGSQSFVTVL